MTDIKSYEVMAVFWDGPKLRQPGEVLQLSSAQAKYRGDEIRLLEPGTAVNAIEGDVQPAVRPSAAVKRAGEKSA